MYTHIYHIPYDTALHTTPYVTTRLHTIPKYFIPNPTLPYHTIQATPYHTVPQNVYHGMPYHTVPYHAIPCRPYHTILVSYHTMPYHTILVSYHTMPYHTGIIPYHTMPCHATPYRTILYHTIPTLTHTIPYHTIPYHTIPYHTIPYHTIPYHTILVSYTSPNNSLFALQITQKCRVYWSCSRGRFSPENPRQVRRFRVWRFPVTIQFPWYGSAFILTKNRNMYAVNNRPRFSRIREFSSHMVTRQNIRMTAKTREKMPSVQRGVLGESGVTLLPIVFSCRWKQATDCGKPESEEGPVDGDRARIEQWHKETTEWYSRFPLGRARQRLLSMNVQTSPLLRSWRHLLCFYNIFYLCCFHCTFGVRNCGRDGFKHQVVAGWMWMKCAGLLGMPHFLIVCGNSDLNAWFVCNFVVPFFCKLSSVPFQSITLTWTDRSCCNGFTNWNRWVALRTPALPSPRFSPLHHVRELPPRHIPSAQLLTVHPSVAPAPPCLTPLAFFFSSLSSRSFFSLFSFFLIFLLVLSSLSFRSFFIFWFLHQAQEVRGEKT